MRFYGSHDEVGAAATELAGSLVTGSLVRVLGYERRWKGEGLYRCADLEVEPPDWGAVVHGVEGCDLVDSHRGHF